MDVPAEVAEGSAIPITIRLRNGGGTPITFVRPALVPALVYLTVENEAGMRLPFLGPSALARDFERHDFITLAPGETTDRSYDLADFYPMPAGSYTLQAEYVNRDDGRRFGLAALVTPRDAGVFSDPVTLTVRP